MDESLCFKTNANNIKEKCLKRLNITKILSHPKWKLSTKTLVSLYRSLIGSIIDYSFFTISEISISILDFLQSIQNQAIRLIFKQNYDASTATLNSISNVKPINERFNFLLVLYITNARQSNPLIIQLIDEYNGAINSIIKKESDSTPLTYFYRHISSQASNHDHIVAFSNSIT